MNTTCRSATLLIPMCLFVLPGCSGIGPKTVVPSRFDYTAAIGDSWKEQMLINMVKTRYGDTLVFLDVTSVISQFQVASQLNWGGTFNNFSASQNPTVDLTAGTANGLASGLNWGENFSNPQISNSQLFGATGAYADRPTITYEPLTGAKFTRTLMKPIPPLSILSLIQSGYPIDLVLRFCTHSINGIRNRYGGSARARPADPDFYPLLDKLRKIQNSGAIGLRVQKTGPTEGVLLSLRGKVDPATQEDIASVRKTLGLEATGDEFNVAFGSVAKDSHEIAILTRSVLEIIIDLSSVIEVPASHVEDHRVSETMPEDTFDGTAVPPLIRIHSSRFKPADAFIAVPYRSHWFWIDDRDLQSKSVFSFLMYVFSLTDTEEKQGAPIVTIPSG